MDLGLENKVAFIAGSSRGIGKGIAEAFLREGANITITGRDAASLDQTRQAMTKNWGKERVLGIAGDLSQPATIQNALRETNARWGKLDCLVINVGAGHSTSGWDVPEEAWATTFEQNLWTSIRIAQAALPGMIEAGRGTITFIASIAGISATRAPLPYSAAKAALVNYATNLATLVAPHGIRVNSVAPGNILFPGGRWEKHLKDNQEGTLRYLEAQVPQNRFGTVEEIADIVAFLSSDRASFVTGACWTADGGQTRKL